MKAKLINRCIYCLSQDSPIDEHVIPKSLGGQSTLQKASCRKCANITSAIITKTTSGTNSLFGKTRIILDMPSRRKKDRPKTFVYKTINKGDNKLFDSEISVADAIDNVYLPTYLLPGIMTGKNMNNGIITEGIQLVHANIEKIKKEKKYIQEFKWDSADFPRLLATIAYCISVDELGLEAVYGSPLIPIILGEKENFGTWIGTATDSIMKKQNKLVEVAYSRPNGHFLTRIKFFNWLIDMPEYLVGVK